MKKFEVVATLGSRHLCYIIEQLSKHDQCRSFVRNRVTLQLKLRLFVMSVGVKCEL